MNRTSTCAKYTLVLILLFGTSLFPQQTNSFIRIDSTGGPNIPKALLTKITLSLNKVPLEKALNVISEKGKFTLSYNRGRVPFRKKVSVKMANVHALAALLHVLRQTGTALMVSKDGQLALVPANKKLRRQGKIKGRVLDKETRGPMAGVNVTLIGTARGAATDVDGWFSVSGVPVGNYSVKISRIGYRSLLKADVIVKSNRVTFVDAGLQLSPVAMDQVVVLSGYFPQLQAEPTSVVHFSAEEIRRASSSLGDVSRALYGLPSIAKVNDTFNSLIVRGGSPSENTFFVDNIEMPNISHFGIQGTSGGFLSLFNGDLVKEVNFYSGGFSTRYGDKLSAVMDISFRDGNRDEVDLQLDLNLSGVSGIAEGPFAKGRGAWLFSARKSFLEILFKIVEEDSNVPAYTDFQSKIVYDLSPTDRLSILNIYGLSDLTSTRENAFADGENEYGGVTLTQNTGGLNWRHIWGEHGYSNTAVSHTFWKYNWNWFLARDESELFDNQSLEQEIKLRNVNTYRIGPGQRFEFGLEAKFLNTDYAYTNAAHHDPLGNATPPLNIDLNTSSQKYSAFVSYNWQPVRNLTLTPGLRADHYAYNGNTHISPRLSFSFELSGKTVLNGALGAFYQGLPLILLYQKDAFKDLRDPVAYHYILGLSHLLTRDTRLTVEAYHKEYSHFPLDPTSPSLFIMDEPIYEIARFTPHAQLTDTGKAFSRGLEVMLQKKLVNNFYGVISGTYFRSRYRDFAGVWRNRIYDNRYVFNIEGGYKPNSSWEFSARWTYAGGRPHTPYDYEASRDLRRGVFDRDRVNADRLPAYNSLNLRFDRRFHFSSSNLICYFSVWNALDRRNVWYDLWNETLNREERIEQFRRTPVFGIEFEF